MVPSAQLVVCHGWVWSRAGMLLALAIGFVAGTLHAAWNVTPEPLPRPLAIRSSGEINIPALPPAGHALFASTPSPFVLVTALTPTGNTIELWNAETGKSTGPLQVATEVKAVSVLSPDGRLMMGDYGQQGQRYTGVYETATAHLVWRSPRTFFRSPWRDFVQRDQVLEVDSPGAQIWDIRKNQLVREILWDPKQLTTGIRLNPSRRYLVRAALVSGLPSYRLQFYDLSDGSLAGELTQPEFPGAMKTRLLQTKFSNDGQEFVALFRVSRDESTRSGEVLAIVGWSMIDGSQQACHEMSREASIAFASEDIDCLPDHSGWLLNNAGIVDRNCGKLVWCVPGLLGMRRIASPSWLLDDGRIVVSWGVGQPGEPLFSVVQPPQDMIRRNIAAVRSGRTSQVLPVAADAPMSPNYRTWTDRSGRNKVVAALVEVGDKDVVLRKREGPVITVSLDELSAEDQQYASSHSAGPDVSGPSALRTKPIDSARTLERLSQLQRTAAAEKKPLPPSELQRCLRQLRSPDDRAVERAIEELAKALPDSACRAEVVKALREVAAAAPDGFIKTAGAWVASVWEEGNTPVVSSPASRPATSRAATPPPVAAPPTMAGPGAKTLKDLERELGSGEPNRILAAMPQAAMQKTAQAAELLVRHYDKQSNAARASLISMGPVAAPAAAKLLKSDDANRRVEVLQILFHIGTTKELDAVEKLLSDGNSLVRLSAAQTQAAIKARRK